uniref:Retrotransposon protein, putative, Ty1-copia subclass n=1 Tax=Tanacetum cinerariifolium TaxID=118510 RepID=A0A6L2NH39_TANCI|nr:retrotransposon protein, putative, Ty1-copia subclass [Tanacetum cinerariifolium]
MRTGRQLATDPEMCVFALTTVINLKWLWKNKKDEDNIVIRNKLDEFVDPDHPEKSIALGKALYGLKQGPRAWYEELSTFLISKGFTKDADYTGFLDTRKSTSDRIQFLDNRFGHGNRFGNGGNRFGRGRGNGFGNKGAKSSRQKHGCCNCREQGHFTGECPNPKENKAFVGGA